MRANVSERPSDSDNPAETAPEDYPSPKIQPRFPLGFLAWFCHFRCGKRSLNTGTLRFTPDNAAPTALLLVAQVTANRIEIVAEPARVLVPQSANLGNYRIVIH